MNHSNYSIILTLTTSFDFTREGIENRILWSFSNPMKFWIFRFEMFVSGLDNIADFIYRCINVKKKRKDEWQYTRNNTNHLVIWAALLSFSKKIYTSLTMQIYIGLIFVLPLIFFGTQDPCLDSAVSTLRPITLMTSSFSYYASPLPAGLMLRDFALCILIAKLQKEE